MYIKYLKYIPVQKLVEQDLSPTQIMIASTIISFHKTGNLRVGYASIGEALNIGSSTVKRNIKPLVDKKLVYVKSGYKERNANEYIPTAKLLALYSQNDPINTVKMTAHTPKGYSKEDTLSSLAKKEGFSKEYAEDLKNYNPEYAEDRLHKRIKLKQTK